LKTRVAHLLIACLLCCGFVPAALSQPIQKAADRLEPKQVQAAKPQPPKLKRLKNGHYRVTEPWTVQLNGKTWTVQAGYKCNGITAPKVIKQSLGDGVDRPATWAAVFHDWLFTQPKISRHQADKLFYDLMLAYKVPSKKAKLMYATVSAYSFSKKIR
jgi:Protein of unknown function (DUF1353)